jgi:hypothetical protein
MVSIIPRRPFWGEGGRAYVQAALEFTVTAQLHKNDLIKGKANKIQGLRNGCASIFGVGHNELKGYGIGIRAGPHTQNRRALADT